MQEQPDDPTERRAEEIYATLPYHGAGKKPGWVLRGNSFMQDEARRLARLELSGPVQSQDDSHKQT